jgi:pimeloyl-ACP methyl ester carboxylesterase
LLISVLLALQVGQDWGGGIAWLMAVYYPQA